MKEKAEGVRKLWDRYKYAALVALMGAGLLLWPSGSGGTEKTAQQPGAAEELADVQAQMEDILGAMSGVGQVRVMLALESDGERILAQDTDLSYRGSTASPEDYSRSSETVLTGGSGDGTVVTQRLYPAYRGAVVVCQGGGRADVRLQVTQAVAALTGLSADRITVAKWQ